MPKKVELAGMRFEYLTVISRSAEPRKWLCRCDCGKEKAILGSSLTTGNTKSCGCSTGRYCEEKPGTRYGRLTVLRRGPNKRDKSGASRGATWVCRCDCGNEIAVPGSSLRSKNTESCGCLRVERAIERNALPPGVSAQRRAIDVMKRNAKNRCIKWELTDEQTINLMAQPCDYCGQSPSNLSSARTGTFNYSGIDRVDSSRGYVLGNVVPCCFVCNNAKRTMSKEAFLSWVRKVFMFSIGEVQNGAPVLR